MNSNEIYSRQNQDKFLKIQYTARVHYNSAENFNKYTWLLCLISAFSIFIPRTWHEYILNGIPFAADLVAMICCLIACGKVKWGATFRKYFDAYVLDISTNQFSETEVREILEKSEKTFLKSPEIGRIQISNTGHDIPPGVKDWYEFSELLDGIEAQFECQRQNIWWNKKMSKMRILATVCLGVVIASAFMLLIYATSNSMLSILLCCGGIIGKIVERLIENIKYFHVSELIIGSQRTVEVHPTKESIEQLQCFIDERRAMRNRKPPFLYLPAADREAVAMKYTAIRHNLTVLHNHACLPPERRTKHVAGRQDHRPLLQVEPRGYAGWGEREHPKSGEHLSRGISPKR